MLLVPLEQFLPVLYNLSLQLALPNLIIVDPLPDPLELFLLELDDLLEPVVLFLDHVYPGDK